MLKATIPPRPFTVVHDPKQPGRVVTLDIVGAEVSLAHQTTLDGFFGELHRLAKGLNPGANGNGMASAMSEVAVPYPGLDSAAGRLSVLFQPGAYFISITGVTNGFPNPANELAYMFGKEPTAVAASIDAYRQCLMAKLLELQPQAPV